MVSYARPNLIRFFLLLSLSLLLSTGCLTSSPPPTATTADEVTPSVSALSTCTAMACFDTLSVTLSGYIPDDYVVTATAPDGESVSVHCVQGVARQGETSLIHRPICNDRGVVYPGFAPDEVTIAVNWDNAEIYQSLALRYESFRPNGPGCPCAGWQPSKSVCPKVHSRPVRDGLPTALSRG